MFPEVLQEAEGIAAEHQYGDEVEDGHECHRQIDDAPRLLQRHAAAHHYHYAAQQTEDRHRPRLLRDVAHVRLSVEIVGNDCTVGKEEDGCHQEPASEATQVVLHGVTGQDDAVVASRVTSAQQNDERRAGADDECIGEDAEALEQALLDGMRNGGCGSSVGGTALAGLVGEETPLHALHDDDADSSASRLFPSEGTAHDEAQHGGNLRDVGDQNIERQQDVSHCHEGHHHGTEAGDALYATEDDGERYQGQAYAHIQLGYMEYAANGIAQRVALHYLVGQPESVDDEGGKQDTHPGTLQAELHVVGRPAVEAVRPPPLEELGECRLHECCACSEQRHHPHPEDRSGAAHEDGARHASQIARPHTAGETDGKGLEGRYLLVAYLLEGVVRRLKQILDHGGQHGELHSPQVPCEVERAAHEHRDDHVGPQPFAQIVEEFHNVRFAYFQRTKVRKKGLFAPFPPKKCCICKGFESGMPSSKT